MRPMTVREALQIERDPEVAQRLRPSDWTQALRILDALVELRGAEKAYWSSWCESDEERAAAAERKLSALERGEEPQA